MLILGLHTDAANPQKQLPMRVGSNFYSNYLGAICKSLLFLLLFAHLKH